MDKIREEIKTWLDANVWDGDDRSGCKSDEALFNPDSLQELVEECFESLSETKSSEWISVEDGHCEFDKKYYVELKDGRFGIGSWVQCVGYVRFKFNGESRAIWMWPEDSRPKNYTELPEGPSE